MPPATPATRIATTIQRPVCGPACIAMPLAAIAPMMNWPSAPMFQTLERKHSARPSAIKSSGVAFIANSDNAYQLFSGSTRNACSPRSGSLPSSTNSTMPISTVIASASSGDAIDIRRLGAGRASSFSMRRLRLTVPQAAHPLADLLDTRLHRGDARRHTALRDDEQPVADLEQFVELFADDEQRAARIAQRQQLAADLRRRADIDAPGRLRDDQQARVRIDLAPDQELLQVATRQTLGHRARAAGLDAETLDQMARQRIDLAGADPAAARHRFTPRQQRVLRERQARHRAAAEPFFGHEMQPGVAPPARPLLADRLAEQTDRSRLGTRVFARQRRHQLLLTVARHTCDADDLAGAPVE